MADKKAMVQRILTRVLLAFTLVSIGFAAGKHAASGERGQLETGGAQSPSSASGVVVYYMHATFRCVTCNTIESMTRELLDRDFAGEMASGAVRMEEVDFQEDEALAARYGIVSSCVVVTQVREGNEVGHQRLDKVWTLMKDAPAFDRYVGEAIRGYLDSAEGSP